MNKFWLFILTLLIIVWLNLSAVANSNNVKYQTYTQLNSKIHTLLIPQNSPFLITTAVAPKLDTLANFAAKYQATAVINGGFFDPQNQQTTSYVRENELIIANPEDNPRLINNPTLTPYLEQILNRSEFRRYQCGENTRYDIVFHHSPPPENCQIITSLGGGPQLLPEITAEVEGFVDIERGRDAIASLQPNARTALGITQTGDIIWVMVEQQPRGLTLAELADFLNSLGAKKALNLDGGSSSSFYYEGTTYLGKIDSEGNLIERPVKSVLLLKNL